MDEKVADKPLLELGPQLLQHFSFEPGYHNLNHGSFGASPREIQSRLHHYQDLAEARPDPFIRYDLPKLLDECRAAVAQLLSAPVDAVVFVTNATVGVNTVLRNLRWNDDNKDEILYFNSIYGACGKTIDYIVESNNGRVSSREISLAYPCEDEDIVGAFKSAVQRSKLAGKRAKICVYDTVSSLPGVRFPFEDVTKACKELGVLSLIDGAQGIGQIKIDLGTLDPDFFVTNCHKWLHVPRSCAVFYVPLKNQGLIPSTLPTSHGYVPKSSTRFNPLPPSEERKSAFVANFEYVGTMDTSAYLCVKDAIRWRKEKLGGEDRIMEYMQRLAEEGGRKAAEVLGTKIMDNHKGTLTKCAMVNVGLPMWVRPAVETQEPFTHPPNDIVLSSDEALDVGQWMLRLLIHDYKTFVALFIHENRVWARLSAQVYLDIHDFEWAGRTLLEVCKKVARKDQEYSEEYSGYQSL
ncbi:putative Pyridoxal phosphate-dependent transferase [Seiridium cardinale]